MAPPFFLKHVTEKNKVGQSADRILPVFYLILYNNFTKELSLSGDVVIAIDMLPFN